MVYKKNTKGDFSEDFEESQEQEFPNYSEKKSKGGLGKIIVAVLVVIIVLAAGWFLLGKYTSLNLPGMPPAELSTNDWQAVFLSNGQVYFGKVKSLTSKDLVLTDIYYLQVVTRPLQRSQEGEAAGAAQTQQELSLFKLGNELHGPTDRMVINRDHILLTEKLKKDSKVVQAISNYLKEQQKK